MPQIVKPYTPPARRHMVYIIISFLAISFFQLTIFLVPTELEGSLLIDSIRVVLMAAFEAIVGIAIVKERLFGIILLTSMQICKGPSYRYSIGTIPRFALLPINPIDNYVI